MFHRLPRVIDISNSSLFSSYLSPKFQRREEPSYVYQVSVIFSLIICTIVLRFEGTCVAAFGSLLRFLLKELPAHWFIAVHTFSSTLAPLTARDKIITEVRVVRVVCTFDGLLMCSNMGDTAATTFQLLYEVNEDVIMAIREKSILLWYAKHCNVTFHWSCIVSLFQCFWHSMTILPWHASFSSIN